MPDPADWFTGLDGPRPLSDELREELASRLLAEGAKQPLGAGLTERLTARLRDPVADLMYELDQPLELSPVLRNRLSAALPADRRRRWWAAAAAAGVAASVIAAAVLVGGDPAPPNSTIVAGPRPSALPSVAPSGAVSARPGPVLGVSSPPPPQATPQPVQAPAAAPAPAQSEPRAEPAAGGVTFSSFTVTPNAGPVAGGTSVRLAGEDLRTAERVDFGTAPGTELTRNDDGTLTVTSPPGAAGDVRVQVVLEDGSTMTGDVFSYLERPQVEALTPGRGPSSGGTWVLLEGSALARVTTVQFGDTAAAEVEVLSDTQVRALSPAHLAGPVEVTATSPGGTSAGVRYLYTP